MRLWCQNWKKQGTKQCLTCCYQDLEKYASPNAVQEWQKLLVSNAVVYLSISLQKIFILGKISFSFHVYIYLLFKMKLLHRKPYFHCLLQQWLYHLYQFEAIGVSFQQLQQDMLLLSWNLSFRWALRVFLVRPSFSDHSRKSSTRWNSMTLSFEIGWICWLSYSLESKQMAYYQQRW